jgi:hypothetical protein
MASWIGLGLVISVIRWFISRQLVNRSGANGFAGAPRAVDPKNTKLDSAPGLYYKTVNAFQAFTSPTHSDILHTTRIPSPSVSTCASRNKVHFPLEHPFVFPLFDDNSNHVSSSQLGSLESVTWWNGALPQSLPPLIHPNLQSLRSSLRSVRGLGSTRWPTRNSIRLIPAPRGTPFHWRVHP